MGSGGGAASEKCSWNEGLAQVPAMFGPDNPAQSAGVWYLTKHQPAAGNREILALSRLSAIQGAAIQGAAIRDGKPPDCPLKALPARRIVPPTDRLDEATEQLRLQIASQAGKSGSVDGRAARLVERQHIHRGSRQLAISDRPFSAAA